MKSSIPKKIKDFLGAKTKSCALKHALKNAMIHDGKAMLKAIIPKMIGENPSLKDNIKELTKNVKEVIKEVNNMTIKEQEEMLRKQFPEQLEKKEVRTGLPELPGLKGRVVMRLAPFPSGAIHIGNIRGMIINDEYAKKYGGKLLLVIDDTIGSEQKPIVREAYKLIPEAIKWLGIKYDSKIIYKSDRLKLFYKYGGELIRKGAAYVCECPNALIRDYRAKGIDCEHRNNSVNKNLSKWKSMLKEEYDEGTAVVRLKTDMKDKDPAFRDRVLFRISKRKHARIGNKYSVWPMLEMSWAVDDMLLGVTHIIRGKELMIEGRMEEFIWNVLDYNEKPEIMLIGLFQIEGAKISKSKSRMEVESGRYTGWDDPRTWSVQSLKRRGFKKQALREFIISMGLSKAEVKVPIESLYTINRKIIDSECKRYSFVKNPMKLIIKDGETIWITEGDAKALSKGMKVRLMDYMNIKLISKGRAERAKDQKTVYDIKKIHYVLDKKYLTCRVLMPDGSWDNGYCEAQCKKIKKGEVIQFQRYAFARLEKKNKKSLEFIYAHP